MFPNTKLNSFFFYHIITLTHFTIVINNKIEKFYYFSLPKGRSFDPHFGREVTKVTILPLKIKQLVRIRLVLDSPHSLDVYPYIRLIQSLNQYE